MSGARRARSLRLFMALRFQFRRYRLPLRATVRTASAVWTEREGILVRLENDSGNVGFGEIAPIPGFGTESVDDAEAGCRTLGDRPLDAELASIPSQLGCVRHGVCAALRALNDEEGQPLAEMPTYLPVAALLPAGRGVLAALPPKAEIGFRTFKWKVGVGDLADELALLDDLCAALPSGAKLRLDANGAWDRRHAERWLERCADRPIEFVEQPCFAPAQETESARRRVDDALLGLAHDYPTPIALDESLVRDGDVERWLGAGWPGWLVVKPSLLGDIEGAIAALTKAKAHVVFSSALETSVGARTALQQAFRWPGERKALGFGVWPLFRDARFDGPAAAPFIRTEDVARLDPEAVWNALS